MGEGNKLVSIDAARNGKLYQVNACFVGLADKSYKGQFLVGAAGVSDAVRKATPKLEEIAGDEFHMIIESVKETKFQYLV